MTDQVELKLIGAENYMSIPRGIAVPLKAGETVTVDGRNAEEMLTLTYRIDRHEYPLFTTDLNAEVNTKTRRAIPLEMRKQLDAEEKERNAALNKEREEKEAALAREAELRERVDKLEALVLANAEKDKPASKSKSRSRAAGQQSAA
jgi:hypothetical protein